MSIKNHKLQHLESDILDCLNHTIKFDVYDETLKHCSLTAVKLAPDFSLLTVYVDTFDRSKINDMVDKLMIAKGFFKNGIAKGLNLRKVPDIKFVSDTTIDNSLKIDKILDNINQSKK
ncbi:MAG: 30S ribosome-binding factor RbfA [Mycoplasmataceae bacterium]|jgi:ribosome-binding factor A|nr:30S ribosome-binding factor RbfA [Mycoplasmataceae bacterium]